MSFSLFGTPIMRFIMMTCTALTLSANAIMPPGTGLASLFKDRETTARLLAPELEKGNLTARDYESALETLPSTYRWWYNPPVVLSPLVVSVVSMVPIGLLIAGQRGFVKLPRRYDPRAAGMTAMTTMLFGVMIPPGIAVSKYKIFLNRLENPSGYERALENVWKQREPTVLREVQQRGEQRGSAFALN
jgi:hypothetical protein